MDSGVVLDAQRDFEALRAPVWHRFRSRHAALGRDRFEDAYAEWWSRELERAAAGRPSRAAAPVPFVAEAVHRVVVDEGRARARGLARHEKGTLRVDDLDSLLDVGAADDTEAQARHEALAHRLLRLVRDRLSPRELQVFVCTFLYLQTTESTARLLGLSAPRVKKDRARVAARVGEEVWTVLAAELDVCDARSGAGLDGVFEVLADHVEDCRACAGSFGGLRRGALAVVGPFELLALAPADQAATLLDTAYGRLLGLLHRWSPATGGTPGGLRGTAGAVAAVVAVAGAGSAVSLTRPGGGAAPSEARSASPPATTGSPVPAPPAASGTRAPRRANRRRGDGRPSDRDAGSPRGATRRVKPAATATPSAAPTRAPERAPSTAPAPPPASADEFLFERR